MRKNIAKKKIKEDFDAKNRRLGVVLEDIDSKLDLMVEGQQFLDKKIEKNNQEIHEFREEVSYKFEAVFDGLRLIRNELKEKVGRDEFSMLEKRVIVLEKRLFRSKI